MTPITRLEVFLNGIIYGGEVPKPITRIEVMLNDIKNGDVVTLTPITRGECYLARISGANVQIPEPVTRVEMYLAKKCGVDIVTPSPIVRIEHWLNAWASGEDPLVTLTGKIISFFSKAAKPFKSTKINIDPVQDLHGYESPWPGGGGKNLLPMTVANMKTINTAGTWSGNAYTYSGVTYTINTDDGGNVESITVNGTASAYSLLRLYNDITYTAETILNGTASGSGYSGYRLQSEGGTARQDVGSGVTIPANESKTRTIIVVPQGVTASNAVFKPMIRLSSVSDATFAPYENICPIIGFSEANIYDEAEYDQTAEPTVTLTFGSTVYGGTASDNGDGSWTVKVFPYYASYNGEPLVGPWLSSMDKYAAGTTPTTGAQVVDLGGTQTTFTVSGDTLETLVGVNTVWADTNGDTTIEVYGTPIT